MVTSVAAAAPQNTQQARAMDKLTPEQIAHPGYYVVSPVKGLYEVPEPEYKRKGGFLRFLGKVILTAVVVGAGAIGVRKLFMSKYMPKNPENAKNTFKNWFANSTDKLYEGITSIFKKSEKKAEDAKTTVENNTNQTEKK